MTLTLACGPGTLDPANARPAAAVATEPVIIDVEAEPVRRGEIGQRVFAPASLVARRASRIGAEVAGRIQEVFVRSGERVEKGAPLFRIDPEPYQAVLRRAEAGLDLARSERSQVSVDLDRLSSLRSDGVGSQSELDHAKTALAIAHARQRQAEEALAMARLDLKRTLVVAPYTGSIADRFADEGTTALAQPQTIVVTIQETTELEARADVAERQLSIVREGDPVRVHVDGLPKAIETVVDSVADTIDPATRTYRVRMRIPNEDHRLRAGIFARVEIQPAAKQGVLLVPRDAIRSEAARTRVLVVRDGQAVAVPVTVGLVSETDAEILAGLEVGTQVIVGKAAQELAPGMRVRVTPAPRRGAT
ncbi:MAG: efflux RND transporter periplasmic adaptor subunit [bacterium]|nr:efflux RND transporter periplasmic adaptor subunit [bacterium]